MSDTSGANPRTKPVCAVVGIGPGNGAAIARKFAAEGYAVALLARTDELSSSLAKELDSARAFRCDVSDPASVAAAFAGIRDTLGEVDVVVYNAGSGVFGSFDNVSATDFEGAWRVNALGLFAVAKEVTPAMKKRGRGALIVIGATASRRGGAKTAAFAPAKAAQKSLTESLARSLWPSGIHVALIIVDGVVDLPRTRARMPGKPDDFFVSPQGVAEAAAMLVKQDRTAWSFEIETRPFGETW